MSVPAVVGRSTGRTWFIVMTVIGHSVRTAIIGGICPDCEEAWMIEEDWMDEELG